MRMLAHCKQRVWGLTLKLHLLHPNMADLDKLYTHYENSDNDEDDGMFKTYTRQNNEEEPASSVPAHVGLTASTSTSTGETDPLAFLAVPESPPLPGQLEMDRNVEDMVNADIARLYNDEKFGAFASQQNTLNTNRVSALQSFMSSGPSTSRLGETPPFSSFHSAAVSMSPYLQSTTLPTTTSESVSPTIPLITGLPSTSTSTSTSAGTAANRRGKKRKQATQATSAAPAPDPIESLLAPDVQAMPSPEPAVEIDDTPAPPRATKKQKRHKDSFITAGRSPQPLLDGLPTIGRVRLEKRSAASRTRHIERPHIPEYLKDINGNDPYKAQLASAAIKSASQE